MPRVASFAGVILAAGESSRMGTEKPLLPWPPSKSSVLQGTFLSAAIDTLGRSTDFVVVVSGRNESTLAPIVYASGASLVTNPDPSRGQFSSLRVGLREVLNRGRDAAIITLIDRPPIRATTLQILREAFENAPSKIWAIVPEYAGKHGHPYLVGREMIEAFLQADSESSARDVEHRSIEHIQYVPVDDPFVSMNINTPEDYAAVSAMSS